MTTQPKIHAQVRSVAAEIKLPSGHRESVTFEEAEFIIRSLRSAIQSHVSGDVVQAAITMAADACNINPALLHGDSREEYVSMARWLAWSHMVACGMSRNQAGKAINKDHSSVINGLYRLQSVETHGKAWQIEAMNKFKKMAQLARLKSAKQ